MGTLFVKLAAMIGVNLSPFLASAIVWAAAGLAVMVWYNHELNQAEERGREVCENAVKKATAEEMQRIEAANDVVRQKDDVIRGILEKRKGEIDAAVAKAIKDTETNRRVCWDRDTINNINRVR